MNDRNPNPETTCGAVFSFDRFGLLSSLLTDLKLSVNLQMQLRGFSIALAVLIMCAGFLPGQTQPGPETGIEGIITLNPARPGPIRADTPVSPLANVVFAVENQKGEIASFTTDNQGHFRVSLAPGHYKVSRKGRTSSIGRYGPFEVDVVAGQMTKVQWECDSGMR